MHLARAGFKAQLHPAPMIHQVPMMSQRVCACANCCSLSCCPPTGLPSSWGRRPVAPAAPAVALPSTPEKHFANSHVPLVQPPIELEPNKHPSCRPQDGGVGFYLPAAAVRSPAPRHQGDHRAVPREGHRCQDGDRRPAAHRQGDLPPAGPRHRHVLHRGAAGSVLWPFASMYTLYDLCQT